MLALAEQLDYSKRMRNGRLSELSEHPDRYRDDYPHVVFGMALMGATNAQIAEKIGVSVELFNSWLFTHPELKDKLDLGREDIVAMAAESLAMRAIGFTYKAEKLWNHNGQVIRAEYEEYVPPDVSAATFILTNRRPDVWAYRHSHEVGGVGGKPIQVENASAREFLERALAGLAGRAEANEGSGFTRIPDGRSVP